MKENILSSLKKWGVIEGGPVGSYTGQEGIGFQVYASYNSGFTKELYPYKRLLDHYWLEKGRSDREKAEEFLKNYLALSESRWAISP